MDGPSIDSISALSPILTCRCLVQLCRMKQISIFKGSGAQQKYPLLYSSDETFDEWCNVNSKFEAGELLYNGRVPSTEDVIVVLTAQITKHDLRELIGMREDDIRDAAKEVISCKVSVKSSKVKTAAVQTLEEWCNQRKMDRAIMNEIMHLVREWPLPAKAPEYTPYATTDWDNLAEEYGITMAAISNLRVEIFKDERNVAFFKERTKPTAPSKAALRPEIKSLITKFLKMDDAGVMGSSETIYGCISAPSIDSLDEHISTSNRPLGDYEHEYLPIVFMFTEDGKPMPFVMEDVDIILKLCMSDGKGNMTVPMRPIVWFSDLGGRDMIRAATLDHECSQVTWFYITVPENKFSVNPGEATPVVCVSIIVPPGTSQRNDSFSKFTGFPKKFGPALIPAKSRTGPPVNWSRGKCHLTLSSVEDFLTPLLKKFKDSVLLNCWGGANVTNMALVSTLAMRCTSGFMSHISVWATIYASTPLIVNVLF